MSRIVDDMNAVVRALSTIGHPTVMAKVRSLIREVERLESCQDDIPSGYSPGPWSFGYGYRVRQTDEAAARAGANPPWGNTVAVIHCDPPCPPPREIEANGLLIARTPELVEEIVWLRREVKRLNAENERLLREVRRNPDPDY